MKLYAPALCCAVITLAMPASLWAGEPATVRTVELFAAVESGDVDVQVIPKNSSKLTLQIENTTDQPLRIQVPTTFAAVPVLAQFQGNNPFGGINNQGNQGNRGNQAVGGPFGGPNFLNGNGNGNRNGPFGGLNNIGPVFRVLPGKVIRKRLDTVCLEHGKPEPNTRIAYKLQRLEQYSDDPLLQSLLEQFGRQDLPQRIVQLAAWHLANDMSWQELAALTHKRANGRQIPMYQPSEIAVAQRLVEQLKELKERSRSDTTARK